MFRKSLLLACMTVLALGVHARADLFSSTTTLNPVTFSGGIVPIPQNGINVTQITSASQPVEVDVSYTVNTNKANPGSGTIYATGVLQLTNYSANPPGTGGSFNTFGLPVVANSNYNFVFALQGHAIPLLLAPLLAPSARSLTRGGFQHLRCRTDHPGRQ